MLFFSWASAPRSVHVVHAFGEKELVLVLFECSQGTYLNCFTLFLPADSPSVSLCYVLHIDPPLLHSFCLRGRSSPLKRGIILHYRQFVAPASGAARIGCTFLDLQCKRCLQLFCSLKATLHVGCVLPDRLMSLWSRLRETHLSLWPVFISPEAPTPLFYCLPSVPAHTALRKKVCSVPFFCIVLSNRRGLY